MSASRLTPAQLADAVARAREGRPDKTVMTNEQRRAAGLMDRRQAAEHERLVILPQARLAERVKGPVPDDIWVTPAPGDAPEFEPDEDRDAEDWASLFAAEQEAA